jgi:hypothetical protein
VVAGAAFFVGVRPLVIAVAKLEEEDDGQDTQ